MANAGCHCGGAHAAWRCPSWRPHLMHVKLQPHALCTCIHASNAVCTGGVVWSWKPIQALARSSLSLHFLFNKGMHTAVQLWRPQLAGLWRSRGLSIHLETATSISSTTPVHHPAPAVIQCESQQCAPKTQHHAKHKTRPSIVKKKLPSKGREETVYRLTAPHRLPG